MTRLASLCFTLVAAAAAVSWTSLAAAQAATGTVTVAAAPQDIEAGIQAYAKGKYQIAADALKPYEQASGRAAGIVCELFVGKLVAPDDERGAAACETAARLADAHGLVWRAMAGRDGRPSLGLAATEAGALGYLAHAAELGHLPAYARLCEYYHGRKLLQQAVPVCKFAAGRGSPDGLYFFALMALEGQGVVQDFNKGRDALLLGASLGSARALVKLAELARDGSAGFTRNKSKAYSWILLASAQTPDAAPVLAMRQSLAAELDAGQMAAAQKRATAWSNARNP